MNVTLHKKEGKKEVINRVELADMANAIKTGVIQKSVKYTREIYHLMNPHRLADGQISTQWEGGVKLPRICFAADYVNRKGEQKMMGYNGLVVLEINDLQTYEKAVEIRELAKKLPKWDGHDYIAELAARVPTSQPHWEKYLRYWLIGMVAQWRESDKQLTGNALTPLLIGRQGCGKTRFCKILLPEELRDYYNDKINFKNEFDLNIALTSFALINIDEFDKTTNSQQIVLKYLLSSSDVKFRPPYGKTIKQYRRYTSFIGTTNQLKPLVDPTGSRRFVCVGVNGNINFEDNLNHYQLFAQALHLFNKGERFWLNDSEIATLIAENEPYQHLNDLVEMIGETFRCPKETEQATWWSLRDISQLLASHYPNFDPETPFQKIGNALNDIQFNFKSKRKAQHMEYWLIEK